MTTSTERPLARLLQLASPSLPVGAYSYSQGLEAAIEATIVHDAASAERWIADVLAYSLARMEAPIFLRFCAAWRAGDAAAAARWNALFLAARETAELRAETARMGYSLARLLPELGLGEVPLEEPSFRRRSPSRSPPGGSIRTKPLSPTCGRGSRTRCWRR